MGRNNHIAHREDMNLLYSSLPLFSSTAQPLFLLSFGTAAAILRGWDKAQVKQRPGVPNTTVCQNKRHRLDTGMRIMPAKRLNRANLCEVSKLSTEICLLSSSLYASNVLDPLLQGM